MALEGRLRVILAEQNIAGKELSNRTGISSTTISLIVNDRRSPTLENAIRIAEALGLKVEDIWKIR